MRLTVGFLSDVFEQDGREILRVPPDDNTSDLLTKAITSRLKFDKFAKLIMGCRDEAVVKWLSMMVRLVVTP